MLQIIDLPPVQLPTRRGPPAGRPRGPYAPGPAADRPMMPGKPQMPGRPATPGRGRPQDAGKPAAQVSDGTCWKRDDQSHPFNGCKRSVNGCDYDSWDSQDACCAEGAAYEAGCTAVPDECWVRDTIPLSCPFSFPSPARICTPHSICSSVQMRESVLPSRHRR